MRHRRSPRGGDNRRGAREGAEPCALRCVRYGEYSRLDLTGRSRVAQEKSGELNTNPALRPGTCGKGRVEAAISAPGT